MRYSTPPTLDSARIVPSAVRRVGVGVDFVVRVAVVKALLLVGLRAGDSSRVAPFLPFYHTTYPNIARLFRIVSGNFFRHRLR